MNNYLDDNIMDFIENHCKATTDMSNEEPYNISHISAFHVFIFVN